MRPSLKRLEVVQGYQSDSGKSLANWGAKYYKSQLFLLITINLQMNATIWTRFLCHFQNGALHFCTLQTDRVIEQNVNFNSFYTVFFQNDSGDHIHPPIFSKRVSFFPQEFILPNINVLDQIDMYKVPKIVKMC